MTLSKEFMELQEALIGRFSLEREIGRGGMGVVYLARDVKLDRPVAIKVMHRELASLPGARERFVEEARTAARLSHPHIIAIYSVEVHVEMAFLVMALIDGESLGQRLRSRGALPVEDAERVLREVAWALGYAHSRGVVHRDLTLENILLERRTGRAVLVDFGLAGKHADGSPRPTFGTPGYLAPEIIRGEPASPSTDLYALGVVVWNALAGRPPIEAESPGQLLAKHLLQQPKPLAQLVRGASRRLVEAVEKCLQKEAGSRPADAAALLGMLDRAPEPITVAPALREWFTRWEKVRNIHALTTPIVVAPVWALLWQSFRIGGSGFTILTLGPVAVLLSVPSLIQIWSEIGALRLLRSRGFGIDDIRSAQSHWRLQLASDRKRDGIPPLAGRVVFDLTVIFALLVVVGMLVFYPAVKIWNPDDAPVAAYFQTAIAEFCRPLGALALIGLATGFASPGFRLSPNGIFRRLVERFWRTRFASRVAAAAALGQRRTVPVAMTLHRNTELVLGLAVDDLWRVIPPVLRDGLGDIPELAGTLQRSAVELRELLASIRLSEGDAAAGNEQLRASLSVTAAAVESRHRETVAALEKLRLQLLRLVATRQQSSELTQQVLAARELEATLLHEVAGHSAVRHLLQGRSRQSSMGVTPTPTPA